MSAYDAVDGSHPTASRCQSAVSFGRLECLLLATSRRSGPLPSRSALPPKADMGPWSVAAASVERKLPHDRLVPRRFLARASLRIRRCGLGIVGSKAMRGSRSTVRDAGWLSGSLRSRANRLLSWTHTTNSGKCILPRILEEHADEMLRTG